MSANDDQIKKLLGIIDTKRSNLGARPTAAWKTNGQFYLGTTKVNINTINKLEDCAECVAQILFQKDFLIKAYNYLEVDSIREDRHTNFLHDFKLRARMIHWAAEDKKIKTLEERLKELRSEDLKKEDALGDIAKALG